MSIAAEMQLGAIETHGLYAKTNLALTGFGKREFVKLKNFGGTGLMKANYLCSFSTKRASPASFEFRVMEDAQDDGVCKGRYRNRILIVPSLGWNARGSKSAWPQIAICPNSEAPARPL